MLETHMPDEPWESQLTHTSSDGIRIRGYDLSELIGNLSYPATLFLLYTGELPTPAESRLIEALMVASIDHGPTTPSALAARGSISGGGTLQAAGAAGLLTMGRHHGAAVEACMAVLQKVVSGEPAAAVIEEIAARGERVPGFGHRQHKERDPRVDRLFELAGKEGIATPHIEAATAIEDALRTSAGNRVPINIDGAMAAVLGDIGVPAEFANAIFITARLGGVLRHAIEEQGMTPMRRIGPDHTYTGPDPRPLPEEEQR